MLSILRTSRYSLSRVSVARGFFSTEELKRTALHDLHLELGGKMVPFAGYSLPVQYDGLGVLKEHTHTRQKGCASLFDVSHMGQITLRGKEAIKYLEKMVCGDIASLHPGESKLSLIMNEDGGIMDDTVITKDDENTIHMVVNGACKDKDIAHLQNYIQDFDVSMDYHETRHLLALQGDGAKDVLSRLQTSLDISQMGFMCSVNGIKLGSVKDCRLTRCGYTGEDGFEISVPAESVEDLARTLLSESAVQPAGLGARDSLRLEAGLCLYGNDIKENITPVQAGLVWTIGGPKSRRRKEQVKIKGSNNCIHLLIPICCGGGMKGFLGAEKILDPSGKLLPVDVKRIGIIGMKAPAREHTDIFSPDGETKIGEITSGVFGPTIKKPIAMGYYVLLCFSH